MCIRDSENIEMAFADVKANIARFNEIGTLMGEPDADFDALMEEMGKLQDAICLLYTSERGEISIPGDEAVANYDRAVVAGITSIMSKMGISTMQGLSLIHI